MMRTEICMVQLLYRKAEERTFRFLFCLFLRVERLPRLHQDKLKNVFDFGAQKCGFFSCILW
jgi:hypothetical protein